MALGVKPKIDKKKTAICFIFIYFYLIYTVLSISKTPFYATTPFYFFANIIDLWEPAL